METKVTVPGLKARKGREPIAALTAYDYPTGWLVDAAGIDLILVGDSLGNTVLGYENTLPVKMHEMLAAVRAVRKGVRRALLVADMPFGSYHRGTDRAVGNAIAFIQAGAEAVKIEGGLKRAALVRRFVQNEIPVLGHIGLTPQSVHAMGGYRVQGKTADEAERLLEDAAALEEAGAFGVVLEGIPAEVAARITASVSVPTIGIGAGVDCDGQILVLTDVLGLSLGPPPSAGTVPAPAAPLRETEPIARTTERSAVQGRSTPRFVRQYVDLRTVIVEALGRYRDDVRGRRFPSEKESYRLSGAVSLPRA